MSVTLFIPALLLGASSTDRPLFPVDAPYKDREGFYAALETLGRNRTTTDGAKRLLGTPDDIVKLEHGDEYWCYGDDKPGGFPTLGMVFMADGNVFRLGSMPSNRKQLMPEIELRAILRKLAGEDRTPKNQTLWLIRTANALIDLGQEKATDCTTKYKEITRFAYGWPDLGPVVDIAFVDPAYENVRPEHDPRVLRRVLSYSMHGPRNTPTVLEDDIPFAFTSGYLKITLSMCGEEPSSVLTLRTKHLTPPDDPFLTCAGLISIGAKQSAASEDDSRFQELCHLNADALVRETLSLVSDVYQPADVRDHKDESSKLEKYREEFLKLHARWVDKLQRYIYPMGLRIEPGSVPSSSLAYGSCHSPNAIATRNQVDPFDPIVRDCKADPPAKHHHSRT